MVSHDRWFLNRVVDLLLVLEGNGRVRVIPGSWRVPAIFQTIQRAGGIADREMRSTFNMGIGMALACHARDAERAVRFMRRAGIAAWRIGTIEQRS